MSKSTLSRSLKLSSVYAMAVGSAVGWGAFVLPYQWLSSAGLLAVVAGFMLATVLIGVVAINYGYATCKLPVTGGGVVFALLALGHRHGFIAGWSLMLGYMGIVALNASAVALVLRLIMPDVMQQFALYQVADWVIYAPEVLASSLFLLIFAYLNVKNTAFSGRVQFLAVLLMLLTVGVIVLGTGTHFVQYGSVLPWQPPAGTAFWSAVAAIVAFAPWAYIGFDSIPQMAGEFNFSTKKIMKLLIASVVSATALYLAMVVASAFAFGTDLANFANQSWATGAAIGDVMGTAGLVILIVAVSMGVLTGLNGFYLASSRILLTMGRAKMLPATFARLHPKHGTPSVAIYAVMAVCLISPWFGRAALLWVVDMTSVGIAITFFYACFCAYRLGKTGKLSGKVFQSPNRTQAVIGALGCVVSLGFLALLVLPFSPAVLSLPAWCALAVWLVVGGGVYCYQRKSLHQKSQLQIYESMRDM
ncbi:APC family permease [Moraxella marmotae]|uniref:APC family permease n=1 Tax=Moraxella marmotae TaxID=3344520 RepID=UPI0035F3D198